MVDLKELSLAAWWVKTMEILKEKLLVCEKVDRTVKQLESCLDAPAVVQMAGKKVNKWVACLVEMSAVGKERTLASYLEQPKAAQTEGQKVVWLVNLWAESSEVHWATRMVETMVGLKAEHSVFELAPRTVVRWGILKGWKTEKRKGWKSEDM